MRRRLLSCQSYCVRWPRWRRICRRGARAGSIRWWRSGMSNRSGYAARKNMNRLWRQVMFVMRRGKLSRDLGEEIAQHIDSKTRKLIEAGLAPAEARYRAQREFGNAVRVSEASREMWG